MRRTDTKKRHTISLVLPKEEAFGTDLRVRLIIGYETGLLLMQGIERIEVHLLNFNSAKQGSDILLVLEPYPKGFSSYVLIRSGYLKFLF